MSYRGNRDKLERDAVEVVRRLVDGEATISGVMAEYHVAFPTLMSIYKARTTDEQRREAVRKRCRTNGTTHGFQPGHDTYNKGVVGVHVAGCEKGWFKKGGIRGAAARKYRAVGTVVVRQSHGRKQKYIKLNEGEYLKYARWIWAQANGPIPDGMNIVHRDGNSLNDNPDNLMCLSRGDSMKYQMATIAGMADKRRKRAGEMATLRHAVNRERRGLRKEKEPGKTETVWDCHGCGCTIISEDPPEQCAKCRSASFDFRRQRATIIAEAAAKK